MDNSSSTKRLAKNTMFLYFRMFLTMGISLFTTRVILNALGVNDYGIYNVVGGMVSLFTVVTASLSASISRFITFELGTGNKEKLKQIFSTAIAIQVRMAIVVLILGATVGFWFLNYKMNISETRIVAANWVLGFSIFSLMISLISGPYNAEIIAHERMKVFAWIGIIEVIFKLIIAYALFIFSNDRLILYALLLFLVSVCIRLIYGAYCRKHFEECKGKVKFDKSIFKEMSSFAGWAFIGASSSMVQSQGNNIILNLFYGTIMNASFSIGTQVNGAVTSFASNFLVALNPQITKSYAQKEIRRLYQLIFKGSKLSFFLLWIISGVVLLNTQDILQIWLKNVPEDSILFVQLFLIFSLCEMTSNPLIAAQSATGKIKYFNICIGGFRMLALPLSYVFLKLGFPAQTVLVVMIFISFVNLFLRLLFLRNSINLSIIEFFRIVLSRIILVILVNVSISKLAIYYIPDTTGLSVVKWVICFIITSLSIYYLGCSKDERTLILEYIKKLIIRKKVCPQVQR